jgi:mannose-6-phosphate isomerase-like protein (cupin superfamily)
LPFINVGRLKVRQPRKGWKGRFFHSEAMTFAYYSVDAGATVHAHSHANDEVWNVIEGQLEITIGNETRQVGAGSAVVVPPNTIHSIRAVVATRAIVVDHPRRSSIGGVDL